MNRLGLLLDSALDRSVVLGYTNVGLALRRRLWDEQTLPRMDGRTVLVTGATSGLGRAAAEGFAGLGASVRLLVRDQDRGRRACEEIAAATGNGDISASIGDLASLASVRRFAAAFARAQPRLDVLVNNAGVLSPERRLSDDGIELTLAVNVIGPFLLTSLLLGQLQAAAPARIIDVSSGGMYSQRLDVERLELEPDYSGTRAYARTKRAEVVLGELWAQRLADRGIVVHTMHPGWADTEGVRESLPGFRRLTRPLLRSAAEGADTILWLGSAEEPARSSGGFWQDRRRRPTHLLPGMGESEQERLRLWEMCERLARVKPA